MKSLRSDEEDAVTVVLELIGESKTRKTTMAYPDVLNASIVGRFYETGEIVNRNTITSQSCVINKETMQETFLFKVFSNFGI
jgi:hypothetical protein